MKIGYMTSVFSPTLKRAWKSPFPSLQQEKADLKTDDLSCAHQRTDFAGKSQLLETEFQRVKATICLLGAETAENINW